MLRSFSRLSTLYYVISATFCVIVVISNILSAKLIKFPYLDLVIPAGLVTYPLTFLLSDLVTEIFGPGRSKLMVYTALAMSLLSFGMIQIALLLPSDQPEGQAAFQVVLGLSGLRIFSSLTAYVVSQIADIQLYALLKRWTHSRWLWLRNNGSTCLSQMIDTLVIDILFLYWGLKMPMAQVWPIMLFSYLYKACFSVATTPLLYLCVSLIRGKWTERWKWLRSARTATALANKG